MILLSFSQVELVEEKTERLSRDEDDDDGTGEVGGGGGEKGDDGGVKGDDGGDGCPNSICTSSRS